MELKKKKKPTKTFEGEYKTIRASLMAQMVKNSSAMQETQVPSLGREDSSEKGMATHSSIVAWRIPWIKELVGYSSWGCKDLTQLVTNTHIRQIKVSLT